MGISNPETQKKVFGPRWEHEIEKQGWPFWKRLMHRHASPNHKLENFNERYRLWLLKNSLSRNPQKLDSVRMPYKRFSPVA